MHNLGEGGAKLEEKRELPGVGVLLKRYREIKDLLQKEVAQRLGVHRNTVGNWEKDDPPVEGEYEYSTNKKKPPVSREDILRLESALRLTEAETDLLLFAASYSLAYGSSVVEPARVLGYEIGPEGQTLKPHETDAPGRVYGYLFMLRGEDLMGSYELRREQVIIGRHPTECDIVIPEEFTRTSRIHAKISRNQGKVYIEDVGSKHKTFVNGDPIDKSTLLKPGQRILLGSRSPRPKVCELEFSWEPAPTD